MTSLLLPGEPLPLSRTKRDELFRARADEQAQLFRDAVANGVADALDRSALTAPATDQYAQPLVDAVAGRGGYQQLIVGVTPAAGASYRYRVPGDWVFYPLSVVCRLVTDGNAADRSVTLEYQGPDDVAYLPTGANVTVAAGQTQHFAWNPVAGDVYWPVVDTAIAPLPQQMIYPANSLVIKLTNGQAGDQLDTIRVNAWLYPTGEPVPPPR